MKRLQTLAPILVFDVAGPLVVFYWLSANGFSSVGTLILSGALPALGVPSQRPRPAPAAVLSRNSLRSSACGRAERELLDP